jgi:nucleoid-associated protein YgaU
VHGYVSNVESTIKSVKNAVSGYVGNILSSSQSVRRITGLAGKTVSDVQNMINETQNQVYRELLGYPELAQATMGEGVAAAAWAREVADNGGDVKTRAVEFRNDAQVTMSNEVMTLHTVREGEDFRTISKRYYGDDGGWRRIMVYNGYDSMSVPVGVEVIVPRKSNNEVS